ncbi:MAG: S-layer homology domain-containing protein [Lachnospiraceae bacterium]
MLPDPGSVDIKPGYDAGWRIDGDTKVLANTSKVSGWRDAELKVTVVNDAIVAKPTVKYSINGSVVQHAGTGVPQLEVAVGPGSPGSVGVQVTHPLATEEARKNGTYVYFKYCWWDEVDDGVNGPRSETEPELFSTAETSTRYNRVYTDVNEIPIRSSTDTRRDGDYYMVEIFGYYVEKKGTPQLYYKSSHNFIGASDTATDARSYVMNVIATDAVTVAIVPADITVYVGGNGYEGAVDGSGALLGEDNGFPVPGFTISAEGLDNFDPAKAVLKYQNDGISFTWNIVPYDGVDGASHGIYRFDPLPGSNTHVKMRFFDEDLNKYVDSDSFDIVGSLGKDFKMEVYGESIEMGYVKLVYGGAEYAVTSGNGKLKVRSTTESEDYGSVVERERDVPRGEPGVVAHAGTTYYINDSDVKVSEDAGVMLLFDDIIERNSASVSNTQLLINRADSVLGGASATRRYEAKYLDLVDTSNGNAWVAADKDITVYWPLPAGTGWNTNFTLLHFEGLHREMGVDVIESGINSCDVTPVTVENTGTHVKFTVSRAGFSPFILVWDEYNTPITPIPEPDDSPVGLNTEDHVAYIIGYEDGTVRPGANITRAEVATIFFRLLTDETRESYWSQSSGFTDVASGAWYNNAVSTLTRAGILDGYEDGSFRPNASITRAEFTKIAVSFFKHAGGASANPFNDVPDSAWYAEFVKAAAELGLIDGYEDGTFRPNAPITRAEACTIVNRTLGRAPDKDNLPARARDAHLARQQPRRLVLCPDSGGHEQPRLPVARRHRALDGQARGARLGCA